MTVGGSQQLRKYRIARRGGMPAEEAAAHAGISLGEAQLHDREDAINPPPPEAFELITPPAGLAGTSEGEPAMARGNNDDKVEEVAKPDFERALRVMTGDIAPASENSAKHRGDLSAAWKVIEDDCHVNKKAAKDFYKISRMSDETQDDYLRSLYGLMQAKGIGIRPDLVDGAENDGKAPGFPTAEEKSQALHTVQ